MYSFWLLSRVSSCGLQYIVDFCVSTMPFLSMRPSLALVLLSCVTYHRAVASLCNDGSESPSCPDETNAFMQLKKITDSKSDEEEMRPYRKRRYPRRYPHCPDCPSCPYNFTAPLCEKAEPQTPRNLSTGAEGEKVPKATVLNQAQREFMPLANVHFHLGAEHQSDDYNNGTDSEAFDDGATEEYGEIRPGWMCPIAGLNESQLAPYNFENCTGQTEVGKTYEIHYVYSTAGTFGKIADGLGGAANGRNQLNPQLVVQALIVQIVKGAPHIDLFNEGWSTANHSNSVMYSGSTTGTKVNNEVCSPYVVSWHVKKECVRVSPESFDGLCSAMKAEGLSADLAPQGSRMLVDPKYVVNSSFVFPYE